MPDEPLLPATPSAAAPAEDEATAVDGRGTTYRLTADAVVVERPARRGDDGPVRHVRRLDAPGDPFFAALPRVDLSDGRPLRRAAFEVWAGHLRARLAAGASWETAYRPRRPYHTAFGMLGGVLVGGAALSGVLLWASSDPRVRHERGLVEGMVLLAGLTLLLWIAFAALASAARLWLTRRGSYVRVDGRGVVVGHGQPPVPPSEVASSAHHPVLRATEIRLRDGRRAWVPREAGPLVRPDLVLAALPGGPATPL